MYLRPEYHRVHLNLLLRICISLMSTFLSFPFFTCLPVLQHTTIRCSSSAEGLYPGTSSRVVTLSSASAAALDAAQSLILLAVAQGYGDAFREVGIVISDIAAGRIIGRAGAQIATLREGCERCELTPRNESSHERMVIISGDVAQMTFTVRGIIDLIMETLSE